MNKLSIFLVMVFILNVAFVLGDVGIVVTFPDQASITGCVDIEDGKSAYDVISSSGLSVQWSDASSFGHMLCKINSVGTDPSGTLCEYSGSYWGFFLSDSSEWQYMPVGFDGSGGCWNRDMNSFGGHYCSEEGDVIGFAFGEYGVKPEHYSYDDLCNKLRITNLDAKVDSKTDKDVKDGEKIKEEAKPESSVTFKIDVSNLYTKDEDISIENVEVKVTIFSIDDGDDLEEEVNSFDINADDSKMVTLKFDVPLKVDEDLYEVLIEAEGEDENGKIQNARETVYLDVDKEKHNIVIKKASLRSEEVSCERDNELDLRIMNLGSEDEDKVAYYIYSFELGINIREDKLELDSNAFDEDNYYDRIIPFSVDNGLKSGVYPVTFKAYYGDTKLDDEKTIYLRVTDCTKTPSKTLAADTEKPIPPQKKQETSIVVKPTGSFVKQEPVVYAQTMKQSVFNKYKGLIFLGFGYLIAILIGIWLISIVLK